MEFPTLDDEILGPLIAFSGAFDENCPELTRSFPLGNGLWPISNGVKGLDHVKGSRSVAWLDGRKNVLFLRWRGERYIPKNVFFPPRGGFNLRCTRERYIPKNVFVLREEV